MRIEPEVIIKTLIKNNGQVRATARELGVSPATVVNWRKRARTSSSGARYLATSINRRSTRPKTVRATSLSAELQDAVLRLRRERGIGAVKIAATLQIPSSYKAVHRFLKQKGLTAPAKNYRRPRYQETTHMQVKNTHSPGKLQMDVKYVTPELSGLVHTAYLYAVMDIYSRYKQGVILPALDQALAIEALKYMTPKLPFAVDFIQTDNGLEFQKRFKNFVTTELGWKHHYIHKSSPNENAVIERSFRTDEEEFFWRMDEAAVDIEDLNEQYQDYLNYYNNERVHLGIDLLTPVQKLHSLRS
jgi:transposase InsO family protein